ncbi:MAG: carboxypeptidase M32 [Alphaproteobacteria bacterium]|jgi:carboxypeptidase Taq|nr:carboxypeptidase M32 [Alphaproteobacteria bacterium]PPR14409.1 MAG: Thermostable carboxypeptidase 1 [Alphaproteobacteria bacterium MarineAlpha12_Bin1]|tara:strand:+ start:49097 stop:50596 length:1500 start_codon:yes stop_codon:yes gene_type:complete
MSENSAYNDLVSLYRRIGIINDAIAILDWDQSTIMPEGSASARSEQLATLSVLSHDLLTHPKISELLDKVDFNKGKIDSWKVANLEGMKRAHLHAISVPADLVKEQSRANSTCQMEWRKAKQENDFAFLMPSLNDVIEVTREVSVAKSENLGLSPYDCLLDTYEPGCRSERIDEIFSNHEKFLSGFLGEVMEFQSKQPKVVPLKGPFSVDKQKKLGLKFMKDFGFDFSRGRVDVSLHPFCGGGLNDVRITTRYDENDFTSSLMGVLHETGHAIYEHGLPESWSYQPVGSARGMAMHESQSLLLEMQVCRSYSFMIYAAPIIKRAFSGSGQAWEVDNLHRLYTRVSPGFIRVDADEVTYPAHIILRYRLERALISNDLLVADLPAAWNEGMASLLGITPPNDSLGCLQDIHWPSGSFGYFPTYTIGAVAAAQFYNAAKKQLNDLEGEISKGKFQSLLSWLRSNIHSKGSLLSADELLHTASGDNLNIKIFQEHLQSRYLN